MILGGDNRDVLFQSKVRLVQSGHFKRNIDSLTKKEITGLNDIILLNYMGSAEFEGAMLPQSLRRMTINKEFYKVFVFNQYKDENGNSLKVYAPQVFFKNIKSIVDRLVVDGSGLQEYCSLHRHIESLEKKEDNFFNYADNREFWWDIENDFFIFFEHTDKIVAAMDALRKRKFGYERNLSKNALSKIYLELLTRPNISRYWDWNTTIKEYFYDKESKIHYIEFLETASLENIFLESIVIAKINNEIVKININGVSITIEGETILDDIITENGIDLVDSSTYSDKINELISLYNEKILKESQERFVDVLRLIRDKKAQ